MKQNSIFSYVKRNNNNSEGLAPNDALPDPNYCNQCKQWNLIALNLLLKLSHNSWMPDQPFCSKRAWSVMRQRHKTP